MDDLLVFAIVYAAMAAMGVWESSVEGRNAWDKGKLGWKVRFGKYTFTRYHFFVWVMLALLVLALPLATVGWDARLFGVLLSALASGMALEDFVWFLANPAVKFSEFNPRFASYYPWVGVGRYKIPLWYVVGVGVAVISWFFLWR